MALLIITVSRIYAGPYIIIIIYGPEFMPAELAILSTMENSKILKPKGIVKFK